MLPASGFVALLAAGALCACFFGCSSAADSKQQKAQAAGPRSVSVAVAQVQRQDVPVYLSGLGAVTPFNTANIKSRVDGQVMKVNVREGQSVSAGEPLIEIDDRPFQVQLAQAQAQRSRDQAQLGDAMLNLERYTASRGDMVKWSPMGSMQIFGAYRSRMIAMSLNTFVSPAW